MISPSLLKQRGLKDTLPRRAVLKTLGSSRFPLTVSDILSRLRKLEHAMGPVTVYRVLDALAEAGLVHRHPAHAAFSLCSMPDTDGHHVLLRCTECGKVEEAADRRLCRRENAVARRRGFAPAHHVSELLGTCARCQ